MDFSKGLVFLTLIFMSSTVAAAKDVETFNIMDQEIGIKTKPSLASLNGRMCEFCEQYMTEALEFLYKNETQVEILDTLNAACSVLGPLRQQCVTLVNYYVPLFFSEISTVNPEEFCKKVHLCKEMVAIHHKDDSCALCHQFVVEALLRLRDPDMQLEIIELLLKGCGKVENLVPQCKSLVLQYAELIIINAEKFLETTDLCTSIHACEAVSKVAARSIFNI